MNDSSLQFAQPVWIAAGLVAVVAGVLAFLRADRRRRADLDKLAHPRFQARLVAGWSPVLRWTRRVLWLVAVMALFVAAARPQLGYEWREVKRRGIDILFAVDTSRSMLAEDLAPNRLERARLGILDFLERLEGDRVGLVPFAGTAFALCPLTLDYDAFRESLNSVNTDLIPQPGTDLASAIHEAERLFDAEGNNQRLLVLITDGEDLEGEALKAAEAAAKRGTTIYTVGVGAADGQRIPVLDRYGRQDFLKDENGEYVETKLDEATLGKIAEMTGGLYVPLGRGAEGLDAIYEKRLALAPKSELAQKLEKVPLERFQWPLGFAILLLAVQTVMGERKRERKRKELVSVARRVRPAALLAAVWWVSSLDVRGDVVADYNSGTEAYGSGEFEQAVEKLKGSLATPDLEVQEKAYYNLGNSLYRLGQVSLQEDPKKTIGHWERSLKAFDDSLSLAPDDEDARFNREFVQRKLDELKQREDQKNPEQDQDQEQKDQEEQDEGEQGEKQDQQEQDSKDGSGQDSKESPQPEGGQEGQQGEESGEKDPEGSKDEAGSGEEGEERKDEKGNDDPAGSQESGDEKSGDEKGNEGESESEGGEKPGDEAAADQGMKGQEEKPAEPQAEGEAGEPRGDAEAGQDAEGGAAPAGQAGEDGEGSGAAGAPGEMRKQGEMSREEAIRLLEALGDDERVVVPVPLSERNRERQQGGGRTRKTW